MGSVLLTILWFIIFCCKMGGNHGIVLTTYDWFLFNQGDRDRHHARDPESPAAEEASAQGCSPVPDQRAAAPQPEGVATQGGPPSARVTRAPAKLRTAAGARDDHEPHQLYNYSL